MKPKSKKIRNQRGRPLPIIATNMGKERGGGGPSYSNKLLKFYDDSDDILLVGEGDFSFTKALLLPPHSCSPDRITATVFDSRDDLREKYPDTAETNIVFLEEYTLSENPAKRNNDKSEGEEDYPDIDEEQEQYNADAATDGHSDVPKKVKLLFKVDATALAKTKYLRKRKFDCCVFNFPHTGSGITDQDRNILKNQELLAGFFKSVISILDPRGTVVVTLFDGPPYSLWNLKELAKAAGFETVRSGKFVWDHYEGYKHRKTSGIGETTKKSQERDARLYIFRLIDSANKDNAPPANLKRKQGRNRKDAKRAKRRKDESSDSADDD
ncbi:hypothetical protein POJ06DRAFT_79159 [Lipomyces tetrasporus]|uniref:25S rRNA (uridine-N(3))-methyltransferase BMT5-like domain-containing protein n=1 Tax=Lipomyces tetrasporus TaxID=54092 RepID=A0AAD7QVC6_9ASCO|nr:uncharacterized protein POJ06DRAFT_79159 [Lipomyces tetrasporus]KAJ8102193.1 hypothetical protein POJ06DRAFT_79159 [Lipomyces tetrasporus]